MIGGTKYSRLALLAALGLFAGGVASAQAADLGGDCCADLEERVAELEATTARKGNRKVSLEVSGWVHESILYYDGVAADPANSRGGKESNVYVGLNRPESNTRFRFVGKAKITSEVSAGYLMEFQVNPANGDNVTAVNDDLAGNTVAVRHSAWWLEHKQMGKVWVGQTSQATDGITEITLANLGHLVTQIGLVEGGAFAAHNKANTAAAIQPTMFNFAGGNNTDSSQIGEGNRRNVVKYESPVIAGFIASAAYGEDDMWDVALRYAGEFSGFKLAFGIGYEQTTDGPLSGTGSERNCGNGVSGGGSDAKCQQLGLSGSIMHVPTGLFLTGHYGWRHDDNVTKVVGSLNADPTSTRWGLSGGIEQNWLGFGKTTVFGEYQQYDIGSNGTFQAIATSTGIAGVQSSKAQLWGIGLNQAIDAAAMDIYVQYRNINGLETTSANGTKNSFDDIQQVIGGAIIRF